MGNAICCGTSDRYQPHEDASRRSSHNRQQGRREIGGGSRNFGGGVVGSGSEWSCSVCTLSNLSTSKNCSACGCARGTTNNATVRANGKLPPSPNPIYNSPSYPPPEPLTEEEKEERRLKALAAAEERSKSFKQGGGGEKLKAKAKALEEAEKRNKELGGSSPHMRWQTNI